MEKICTWYGGIFRTRRALEDINCRTVIRGRVLIVRDMNNYGPVWNPYFHQKQSASILEEIIDQYGLLVNNESERST